VNINTKDIVFHTPTLPVMTLSSSTTARFFKSAPYDYDRGYLMGVSFVGSLLKHNEGVTDADISLAADFIRGALLTNV
jgi:hypothetical protein